MLILGIESSCDETSASVIEADKDRITVRSNAIFSQIGIHALYGGVVPEIASRAHADTISSLTYEALREAKCTIKDIELVAVTSNPGLIGALLVGVNFAKSLAFSNNIPLVAVDHIKGHIAASYIDTDGGETAVPPFIALAVSGGHTAIYLAESRTRFSLLGSTRDDAMGESFDKIGRMIGIPYPAGAGFDRLAEQGLRKASPDAKDFYSAFASSTAHRDPAMHLPSPAIKDGSLDLSFSGLKTAAINLIHRFEQKGDELPRELFAAEYTYQAVEAVTEKISDAMDRHPGLPLVVAGGVAANSHLRHALSLLASKKNVKLIIPPARLCGDNAAMIAAQGYYEYKDGHIAASTLNASAEDSAN